MVAENRENLWEMEEQIPNVDVSQGVWIASGAFGHVFLLTTTYGLQLAVKQIRFTEADQHTVTDEVTTEYNLLKRLSNDRIVQVYDLQAKPDQLLLVMEYMPGGTLRQLIDDRGLLPEELALDFICQLLEGVRYMISRDVVNRDIKPTNIMLNMTRTALKIADFGCGTRLWYQRPTALSKDRGTMVYRSPETFRPDVKMGKICFGTNAEIWSCGMVLYEMLVGQCMFEFGFWAIGNLKRQSDLNRYRQPLTGVSAGTKKLLDALLTVNKHYRPKAQEALEMANSIFTKVKNTNQTDKNKCCSTVSLHQEPTNHQQNAGKEAPKSVHKKDSNGYPTRPTSEGRNHLPLGNRIAPREALPTINENGIEMKKGPEFHRARGQKPGTSIQTVTWPRQKRHRKYFAICISAGTISILVCSFTVFALVYHMKKDNSLEDFGSIIYLFGGAGGLDPNQTLRTVQVYSPFNPAATSIPESLNLPIGEERAGHVSAVLTNGIVLIAGGSRNGGDFAMQSTLYFNRSAIDTPYTKGPDLLEQRYWAAGAVLNDTFYVCGGWSFRNSCEYLETNGSDNHWAEGVPMLLGRDGPVMTSLNGYLYAIGGYNTEQKWLSQVERFDPTTQKWTPAASLNTGRSGSAAATFEGKIIICGGDSTLPRILPCESYDPTQDKWTQIAPNNVLRLSPSMVVVRENLYILAGQGQTTVERYLKEEDRWETLDLELDIPRQSFTAVGFPDTI